MNEKTESEFRELLEILCSEKNQIKELTDSTLSKVGEFHATVYNKEAKDSRPSSPGLLGEFRTLIDELKDQRQVMELILKELITIVG